MNKCMVCGNLSSTQHYECPKCGTKNAYLPTNSTDSSPTGISKDKWDKDVNKR